MIKGKIHSIQTLGTLDGPGVRFVVFMQGCNLRCSCCHNPDTWEMQTGKEITPSEVLGRAAKYKEYFGDKGGITLSGGEPLLQPDFICETFKLCHAESINTCLDTSGSILNEKVKEALKHTDRVLLDIKYTENEHYERYVGCKMDSVINFLEYLNDNQIKTTLRQVVIPTVNDYKENFEKLRQIGKTYGCVDKIELLPFRKICKTKYENMGIAFPFANIPEASYNMIEEFKKIIG